MSLLSQNLQAFIAIVKNSTVHGAANDLGLTQTAVTQRIRALENELGVTLFLRSRKGMQLTQEGEALLRYCQGAEDLEGQALSLINGAGKNRTIEVNMTGPTSVMTSRIVPQCANLYNDWPQLNLNFIITDTEDRLQLLKSGSATLAILPPDNVPNELDSKMLKPDRYVLVASKKWKGRRLNDILTSERLIDFYETDQTSLNYLKKFKISSLLERPRLFVNNNEAIIKLFCQGVGFGTLTQEIAKPHLDNGDLITLNNGATMDDPLALAWYPRPEMPKYFKAIIDSVK
ncbi:MAG: LysR family transcriptional regulator [Pseudobdellovibrionaceae bacterium]